MRFSTIITAALLLTTTLLGAQGYDVIVRNGRIIDGTGNGWFYADLGVRAGRIATIGTIPSDEQTTRTIDAKGLIVAPGFIDVHSHADADLYEQPKAENFIRNGVTTIISGNCGSSLLDVKDYFDTLEKNGVGLNVATLIGHNTILQKLKGLKAGDLTPDQLEEGKKIVDQAMQDGAMGLSTGLIYRPGTWSNTAEIVEFAKISSKYGGNYTTHMRSESTEILKAIEETLEVGRQANCRVQISHFKMPRDVAETIGGSNTTLAAVVKARNQGMEVWIDQYPYTASSTSLSTMLPDWVLESGPEAAKAILQDPVHSDRIMKSFRETNEIARKRKDLSYAVVASCRAFPEFNGRNLLEITKLRKARQASGKALDWKDVTPSDLPPVAMIDQYETVIAIHLEGGAGMVFHTMDERDVENIMRHPLVSICSDSGVRKFGSGVPHPRGYGTNARVLGKYVRERGVISLEEAVRKMTSLPAQQFRIEKRGTIREGYWADLTIFNPDTVTDNSTFEDPHHYSTGFAYVIVNGQVAVENDTTTDALAGRAVRRGK